MKLNRTRNNRKMHIKCIKISTVTFRILGQEKRTAEVD